MDSLSKFDYLFKYIIIGDSSVGKSNLLLRYIHDQFTQDYQLTIGVEFGAKNVTLNKKIYRIQIWDTAGQENYRSITRTYYKNSACAIIVYDITNRISFNNVQNWMDDCRSQSPKSIYMVLVGNKSDLGSKRQVQLSEGADFANKNNMLFLETSALDGQNVEEIFVTSAKNISKKIEEGFYNLSSETTGIKIGFERKIDKDNNAKSNESKDKGCC